jgi:hypothetical protein
MLGKEYPAMVEKATAIVLDASVTRIFVPYRYIKVTYGTIAVLKPTTNNDISST